MSWENQLEPVRAQMQAMHDAREIGLAKCRQLIQTSAKAIRHIHRHQFEEAQKFMADGKRLAKEARTVLEPFGELTYAGYLSDAEKELVEAHGVFALIHRQPLPSHSELGVGVIAYLNGMGEAASECRRYAVDLMRKGNMQEAEDLLAAMEAIYDDLITFDYADSMTGGLRRTCDALRPVLERTRNDFIATAQQQELMAELKATRERLRGSDGQHEKVPDL